MIAELEEIKEGLENLRKKCVQMTSILKTHYKLDKKISR